MIWLTVSLAVALSAAMALAWVVQRVTRNAGWVDAVWSFATGAAGAAAALIPLGGHPPTARAWLAAGLIGLWSARLGLHIARRSAGAAHEDPRYAQFRADWGAMFEPRLFAFLQIQAACSLVLAVSVMVAARNPAPALAWSDIAAALVSLAAIAGEGLADEQLRRFKAAPANKGRVCDTGLWAWSRHPNYFFEWLGWLAWPVMAVGPIGGWRLGWIALAAPVLMFWLLRFASGVPPLEAAMLKSRGEAFADYQARTSAFFPRPPRRREPNLTRTSA
jgi:steroid 5-alpha reductase family enzyme